MEIIIRRFSRSQITNRHSKFRNSRWRIQYGGPKCKNSLDWDENCNSGVFGVSDYELTLNLEIQDGGYNMADENVKIHLIGMKIITRGFSRFLMTNLQLKFGNSIWRIQYGGPIRKNYLIGIKMSTRGFSRSLITNQHSKFRNSKWRIQYSERKCRVT